MHKFPDIPPMWLLATLFLTWVLKKIPFLVIDSPTIGRIGILIGIGFIIWSAYWFYAMGTTIHPHGTPEALIVEGPYKINRNPIYAGMILIAVGYFMSGGSLLAGIPVIGFFFILDRRFVQPEEAMLRKQFGDAAEAYFNKTRRW